jgi:D-glycero-D-manno-heptose 1,7-bisphosphate phosphatase
MKVILLDRDGVINEYPGDADYVKSRDEFHFLPRVKSALKKLSDAEFKIFVISNQAGVSKGIYSQENLDSITRHMLNELKFSGITIAGVYYCIHRDEDNCSCRKPKTGLIDLAFAKLKDKGLNVKLDGSYLIGDTTRDIETGKKRGLKTILVFSGKERPENKKNWPIQPDFTASDLFEATKIILK